MANDRVSRRLPKPVEHEKLSVPFHVCSRLFPRLILFSFREKGQGSIVGQQRTDITEKLSESERLMKEMSQTWEEKLVKTERLQHERQQALEKMGISVQASGIQVEKNKYYLVNLNDDPSLNELLVYYLKVRKA